MFNTTAQLTMQIYTVSPGRSHVVLFFYMHLFTCYLLICLAINQEIRTICYKTIDGDTGEKQGYHQETKEFCFTEAASCYGVQASFELRTFPPQSSNLLGLQVCATTPHGEECEEIYRSKINGL